MCRSLRLSFSSEFPRFLIQYSRVRSGLVTVSETRESVSTTRESSVWSSIFQPSLSVSLPFFLQSIFNSGVQWKRRRETKKLCHLCICFRSFILINDVKVFRNRFKMCLFDFFKSRPFIPVWISVVYFYISSISWSVCYISC